MRGLDWIEIDYSVQLWALLGNHINNRVLLKNSLWWCGFLTYKLLPQWQLVNGTSSTCLIRDYNPRRKQKNCRLNRQASSEKWGKIPKWFLGRRLPRTTGRLKSSSRANLKQPKRMCYFNRITHQHSTIDLCKSWWQRLKRRTRAVLTITSLVPCIVLSSLSNQGKNHNHLKSPMAQFTRPMRLAMSKCKFKAPTTKWCRICVRTKTAKNQRF